MTKKSTGKEDSNRLFPEEIILEVTNRCNLRCRYCHFHGREAHPTRDQGDMDRKIWEKVLDELKSWSVPVTVMTHGAGEPLLYRDLRVLLREAKKIPHVGVGFMTNAMLLDRAWAVRLVDMQVDWIAFSVDGIVPKTHDYFRTNANLALIEKNIMHLIGEKERQGSDRPFLNFNMVGYPEILDQSLGYVKKWLPHAQNVTVSKFRPVGSRHLWNETPPFPFRPCPLLYRQMVIGFDGTVGLCCEDINIDVKLGRVGERTLAQIFSSSPAYVHYRNAHEKGEVAELLLCNKCHVWGGDIPLKSEEVKVNGMGAKKISTPAFVSYQRVL